MRSDSAKHLSILILMALMSDSNCARGLMYCGLKFCGIVARFAFLIENASEASEAASSKQTESSVSHWCKFE